MIEKLEHLQRLLRWKESKAFMAKKLDVSLEELESLLVEVRCKHRLVDNAADQALGRKGLGTEYDIAGGWVKEEGLSVRFSKKGVDTKDEREEFVSFLKDYTPAATPVHVRHPFNGDSNACLVINKQDAHLNKYDIKGSNNIQTRFDDFYLGLHKILRKATAVANLEYIVYVIGSDEFNSEHTGRTSHDTPQHNLSDYHKSFEDICNHEISVIGLLRSFTKNVSILYVPGNHDEHVGWHLATWLKTYYRNCPEVTFDVSPSYTKYVKYDNTGMCFNHGVVKPEVLAQNFPAEFREHWSACNNFYIFAGDKHTELTRAIGNIKFYRISQISKSKSKWDMERGFGASEAEITAFLIEEGQGITDIYHQSI